MGKKIRLCIVWVIFFCTQSYQVLAAPVTVEFWHAMAGPLGNTLNQLVAQFNASQNKYRVMASYKGDYTTTLANTVAAYRAHRQPHIVQIYDVGTAMMILPRGAIMPLHHILAHNHATDSFTDIFPIIRSYYADQKNRLLALPFNASVPVLYFNKEAFRRAGLDGNKPPTTWPQLKAYAERLLDAGIPCGFTTTWPGWIHVEAFSARHDLPFADQNNGYTGLAKQLLINNTALTHHLTMLAEWQKKDIFKYGGQGDNAQSLFTSGYCAMLFQSSGSMMSLQRLLPFPVGMAALPFWPSINVQPKNPLVGGAALWVLAGHSESVYQGVLAFMQFLLQPEQHARWISSTGYLALTDTVMHLPTIKQFYQQYPAAKFAQDMILRQEPTRFSKGIRLGNYSLIRESNNDALEAIWSGKKTAKQALLQAEQRASYLLRRFSRYAAEQPVSEFETVKSTS